MEPHYSKIDKIMRPLFERAVDCRGRRGSDDFDKWQEVVSMFYDTMHSPSVYFHDSYNDSSLMSRLDGVTWKDACDQLDDDGCLGGDKLKRFLGLVESAKLILPGQPRKENCGDKIFAILKSQGVQVDTANQNRTDEEDRRYFCDKLKEFKTFLFAAIATNSRVRFSC